MYLKVKFSVLTEEGNNQADLPGPSNIQYSQYNVETNDDNDNEEVD